MFRGGKLIVRDINQLNHMVTADSIGKSKPGMGDTLKKPPHFASNLWVKFLLLVLRSMLGCVEPVASVKLRLSSPSP